MHDILVFGSLRAAFSGRGPSFDLVKFPSFNVTNEHLR